MHRGPSLCDKCGLGVHPRNDVTLITSIANGNPNIALDRQSRHFLPVYDSNGKVICDGSPNRAQYIEGQSRDVRGRYPYVPSMESKYRRAYSEIVAYYGPPPKKIVTTPGKIFF